MAQQSELPNEESQKQHNEWKIRLTKFFNTFKKDECEKGTDCPKGINCIKWHNKQDKRRDQYTVEYQCFACPILWDYQNKRFKHETLVCPDGDQCPFSHNFYESWYHSTTYKTLPCPYLILAFHKPEMGGECPFVRDVEWFQKERILAQNPVDMVFDNIVVLRNNQKCCLDYCPFYHSKIDQMLPTESAFVNTLSSQTSEPNKLKSLPVSLQEEKREPPNVVDQKEYMDNARKILIEQISSSVTAPPIQQEPLSDIDYDSFL